MADTKLHIVIPPEITQALPLLFLRLPHVVNVGGRDLDVQAAVLKIVADGILDETDAFTIVAAYLAAPKHQVVVVPPVAAPPTPTVLPFPTAPTPGVTPPKWVPPTGSKPAPQTAQAQALALVAGLGIEFELKDTLENDRKVLGYTLIEHPDAYEIVLTDRGTSNFPLHGGAYLHAIYLDKDGVPINFEQRGLPELYTTAIWQAEAIDGVNMGIDTLAFDQALGRYNQVDQGAHIANWNNEAEEPREATRTGGMDVPVHFPDGANDRLVQITVMLPTGVKAKPIRFPKIS